MESEGNAYFRRMERKVFSLDESSGALSGVVAAVDDMVRVVEDVACNQGTIQ